MENEFLTLAEFAKKMNRTADCVYKWMLHGRLNRFTNETIKCKMTRLPSGAWGVSQSQYDDFLRRLNVKP